VIPVLFTYVDDVVRLVRRFAHRAHASATRESAA
jgi:hypothetical protein